MKVLTLRLAYSRNAITDVRFTSMSLVCSGNFDILGVREVNDHIHFLRERSNLISRNRSAEIQVNPALLAAAPVAGEGEEYDGS